MPFPTRTVPSRGTIPDVIDGCQDPNFLQRVNVNNMIGVLSQLNLIAKHAGEVFGGIAAELDRNSGRLGSARQRLDALHAQSREVEDLFSEKSPAYFYDSPFTGKEWSRENRRRGGFFRRQIAGRAVDRRRAEGEPAPNMAFFDRFNDDKSSCNKKFSDPDFFVKQWLRAERAKRREDKAKRKDKKDRKKKTKKRKKQQKIIAVAKPEYDASGKKIEQQGQQFVEVKDYQIDQDLGGVQTNTGGQEQVGEDSPVGGSAIPQNMAVKKPRKQLKERPRPQHQRPPQQRQPQPQHPQQPRQHAQHKAQPQGAAPQQPQQEPYAQRRPSHRDSVRFVAEEEEHEQKGAPAGVVPPPFHGAPNALNGGPPKPPPPAFAMPDSEQKYPEAEDEEDAEEPDMPHGGPPPVPAIASYGSDFSDSMPSGPMDSYAPSHQPKGSAMVDPSYAVLPGARKGVGLIDEDDSGDEDDANDVSDIPLHMMTPEMRILESRRRAEAEMVKREKEEAQRRAVEEKKAEAAKIMPVRGMNFLDAIRKGTELKKVGPIKREKPVDKRSGLLAAISSGNTKLRKVDRSQIEAEKTEEAEQQEASQGIFAILDRRKLLADDSSDDDSESDWGSDED